jgi:hypothetical protein
MKKLLFSFIFLTLASPTFALLSPLAQSVREIDTIVSSKELSQFFAQNDTITEIKHEGDCYLLKTEDKQIVVEVVYVETQRVGPKEFKLVFHPVNQLD